LTTIADSLSLGARNPETVGCHRPDHSFSGRISTSGIDSGPAKAKVQLYPLKRKVVVEPLPDLASTSDEELKGLIDEYTQEEQEVSYRRRILHGKIDILRAELVARLQKTGGRSVLDDVNVAALTEILAGKAAPPAE
jgi:hypothetical protein